jgi:hypothetical protein
MSLDETEVAEPMLLPIDGEHSFDTRLREFAAITKEVEEVEQILKEKKAYQDALSQSLAQYMLASGCLSKVLDGKMFKQKQKVYSKVEDKEALREWIQQNDAVDLLMAVHPSKLTAYCNEQLEAGNTTPTGVNPNYIKYFVSVK